MKVFQHIALNCSDIHKQETFYTKHFGFRLARVFLEGEPEEFRMLKLGSMRLELFPSKSCEEVGGEQPVGFKHLAFEVESIESVVADLAKDGIVADPVIDAASLLKGLRVCFFKDPEGNILELMEGYIDQFLDTDSD